MLKSVQLFNFERQAPQICKTCYKNLLTVWTNKFVFPTGFSIQKFISIDISQSFVFNWHHGKRRPAFSPITVFLLSLSPLHKQARNNTLAAESSATALVNKKPISPLPINTQHARKMLYSSISGCLYNTIIGWTRPRHISLFKQRSDLKVIADLSIFVQCHKLVSQNDPGSTYTKGSYK